MLSERLSRSRSLAADPAAAPPPPANVAAAVWCCSALALVTEQKRRLRHPPGVKRKKRGRLQEPESETLQRKDVCESRICTDLYMLTWVCVPSPIKYTGSDEGPGPSKDGGHPAPFPQQPIARIGWTVDNWTERP